VLTGEGITGDNSPDFYFTPNDGGIYVVNMTVDDHFANGIGVDGAAIEVAAAPRAVTITDISANPLEGDEITLGAAFFPAVPPKTLLGYDWKVTKNGQPFASGENPTLTFTPDDNGYYVASLTVTAANGDAVGSATVPFTVANVGPTVVIHPNFTNPSTPNEVHLAATVTDKGSKDTTFTYRWCLVDAGGQTVQTGTQPTFAFAPGNYVVKLKVTDKDGGVGTDSSQIVTGTAGNDTITVTDSEIIVNNTSTSIAAASHILVLGLSGDDTIDASATHKPVVLDGGAGDDNLTGGIGDDVLYGGLGNDHLIGGPGNDAFYGQHGDDMMDGMGGSDTFFAQLGSNLVIQDETDPTNPLDVNTINFSLTERGVNFDLTATGGSGFDMNGATMDTVTATGRFAEIVGSPKGDKLTTSMDGSSLFSGDGDDTLIAMAGTARPCLFAGNGNDDLQALAGTVDPSLFSGDGNDHLLADNSVSPCLFSGNGTDDLRAVDSIDPSLFSGDGNDHLLVDHSPSASLWSGAGTDNLQALNGSDDASLFAGDGNDTVLAAGAEHASLWGGAGDDLITAEAVTADASLFGGTGSDQAPATLATDGASLFGGDGSDALLADHVTHPSLWGGAGADDLQALDHSDDPRLFGGSGDDVARTMDSLHPSLWGGTGNDILGTSGASDGATMAGEEGDDAYQFGATVTGTVTVDEVMKVSAATPYDDATQLGNDTLDFSALNGITIDLGIIATDSNNPESAAKQMVAPNFFTYLFGTFENVIGSPGDDSITGNAADNRLTGGAGNDTITGAMGNDTLDGGSGNNVLIGNDSMSPVAGHDVYRFTATDNGQDTIVALPGDRGTLDFSGLMTAVSVDLKSASPQAAGTRHYVLASPDYPLAGPTGITGVIGTAQSDTIVGNDEGNSLAGGGGDDMITGGTGGDTLVSGDGDVTMSGGAGNDLYKLRPTDAAYASETSLIDDYAPSGATNTDGDIDTIDFSGAFCGVSVDLSKVAGQPDAVQTLDAIGNTLTLDGTFENVIGSRFSDHVTGNAQDNRLYGRNGSDVLDGGSGSNYLQGGITQVVLLDFDTYTKPVDHQYTEEERLAIRNRLQTIFSAFSVEFTLDPAVAAADSLGEGGQYVTEYFNKLPPGGKANEIDWGNLNLGGETSINVNFFLGGDGQLPLDVDGDASNGIDSNVVAMSAEIAAHEFGHLNGLLHPDSQGSIGSGPFSGVDPARYIPIYVGTEGAVETPFHIMASPDSVHTTLADATKDTYLGEREAIKLAFDDTGVVVNEQAGTHGGFATAQQLGALPGLTVPNTLMPGDFWYGDPLHPNTFQVRALDVVGALNLDPTTGATEASQTSENDWYSFTGHAGDLFNAETCSRTLNRGSGPIDSILRLYDSAGQLLRVNDDGIETTDSVLLDVTLPADGTYYLEVDTFAASQPRVQV
jgi:Ca2+-binding RTX toxin-like protein